MKYNKPKHPRYVKKEGSRFKFPEGLNPYKEIQNSENSPYKEEFYAKK